MTVKSPARGSTPPEVELAASAQNELDALIEEARRRARRRRAGYAAVAVVLLASAAIVVLGFSGGGSATTPAGGATAGVLPTGPFASLRVAGALAVTPDGALYVADVSRDRVLVRLPDGRFRVVAGDGRAGFAGDGGPAVRAKLSDISALAVARTGTLYIADGGRVRVVGEDGVIRTIAGDGRPPRPLPDGAPGRVANGTPALSASLGSTRSLKHNGAPLSIALSRGGQLYISTYSQILRLTQTGRLDVVRAIVRKGRAAGPLNQIGSIAVSARGYIDAGTLDLGWSIWQAAPGGIAREIGYARGIGGNIPIVQTAPDGVVYGESGGAIVRITRRNLAPVVTFARPVNSQYFSLSYFAYGPAGSIYADDLPGNTGFQAHQQLLSVAAGHIRLLWQQNNAAPK